MTYILLVTSNSLLKQFLKRYTILYFFLEIIRICPTPEPDVDYCANSPCQNNGTCYNTTGDYVCVCQDLFEGKNCSRGIEPCFCWSRAGVTMVRHCHFFPNWQNLLPTAIPQMIGHTLLRMNCNTLQSCLSNWPYGTVLAS